MNAINKKQVFFICFALATLSSCAIKTIPPAKIEIPAEFEATAQEIKVKSRSIKYRSKHYDTALGDYRANNSKIRSYSNYSKETHLSTIKHKDSWLDLLLDRKLFKETTTYNTYGKARSRSYGFDIAINNDTKLESACNMTSTVTVEKKSVKSFLGTTKKKSTSPNVATENSQWLQSAYSCELMAKDNSATLSVLMKDGMKPVYIFKSNKYQYQLAPMYNLVSPYYRRFEDAPTISNETTGIQSAPARLSGISIYNKEKLVTVISLTKPDTRIFLKKGLDSESIEMLLGISHSLILSGWVDDDQ